MRKKTLKWTGIVLGSLLLFGIIFYAVAYFQTESRANKVYDVSLQTLTLPNDSVSYALGKHIARIRGCMDCHKSDLSGNVFADESSPIGVLYASNLTSGKGGIKYKNEDWIRALRHGLGRDYKTLWFMPAQQVSSLLSNRELGALIYFLNSQPPVDKSHPAKELKPLGRVLTFLGEFPMFPAEFIDHSAKPIEEVRVAINSTYGGYLATTCMGCHGANLKGGPAHGEGQPAIPDISTSGRVGKWSSARFITTLRTGKTPEGRLLSDAMPWKSIAQSYTDTELQAMYLYIQKTK